MINVSSDEIETFLNLFEGDVQAAQKALSEHELRPLKNVVVRNPIITIRNVSKSYALDKQTVNALHDVSLVIGKGEFVAITGTSGSGKSTLLQIIGCLEKPTSGSVVIESKETTDLDDNALSELRQKAIGFIFQSFYLQPFLRLSDNLAIPAMFTDRKKKDINDHVTRLLQQVGLTERAAHFPREMSGGQVQRAAIARALMNNPRIILADEPTGNLDSANTKSIIDLFHTIRDNLNTTVVVVTHDINIARQADRIIELKDGSVL